MRTPDKLISLFSGLTEVCIYDNLLRSNALYSINSFVKPIINDYIISFEMTLDKIKKLSMFK